MKLEEEEKKKQASIKKVVLEEKKLVLPLFGCYKVINQLNNSTLINQFNNSNRLNQLNNSNLLKKLMCIVKITDSQTCFNSGKPTCKVVHVIL